MTHWNECGTDKKYGLVWKRRSCDLQMRRIVVHCALYIHWCLWWWFVALRVMFIWSMLHLIMDCCAQCCDDLERIMIVGCALCAVYLIDVVCDSELLRTVLFIWLMLYLMMSYCAQGWLFNDYLLRAVLCVWWWFVARCGLGLLMTCCAMRFVFDHDLLRTAQFSWWWFVELCALYIKMILLE